MSQDPVASSQLLVTTSVGGSLLSLLMAPDIEPGSDVSYQLCKSIYIYHPLGKKMADTPIVVAMSRPRKRVVQGAPNEVMEEFNREWARMKGDDLVLNTHSVSRIYGISSLVLGIDGEDDSVPADLWKIWDKKVYFNILDPLNTAGSLVLSQIPTSPHFNKPVTVRTQGKAFHPSRFSVVMNEQPVYLAYSVSAFGFVGRSVYQRALFPLKSYIRSMIANDMILTKLGLLVVKKKKPGSLVDNIMLKVAGIARELLKQAQTGQVLQIDVEESIETLNMMNVDGAGTFARTNVLKDVATAADMPAVMLENETMVGGFGEGTEDAKNISRYIDGVRGHIEPSYAFLEPVAMHRAWSPEFYKRIQVLYPDQYGSRQYEDAFMEWRNKYHAEWESFLVEPESESVNVEKTKNESVVAVAQTLLAQVDPENKLVVIQWMLDNIQENKRLFPHEMDLDVDALKDYLEQQAEQAQAAAEAAAAGDEGAEGGPVSKKFGRMG